MKNKAFMISLHLMVMILGSVASQKAVAAASLQWTALWNCPVADCADCRISVDLAKRQVEYIDSSSSHILKQNEVSKTERVFHSEAVPTKGAPAFKAVFARNEKTMNLFVLEPDQSERALVTNSACESGEAPKLAEKPASSANPADENAVAKDHCRKNGGVWKAWSKGDAAAKRESCRVRAIDANASCSDGKDCSNRLCIYDPVKKAGYCSEYGGHQGCHQRMVLGKPTDRICID